MPPQFQNNLEPTNNPPAQKPPHKHSQLMLLTIAMILVGILAVGYFFYQNQQSSIPGEGMNVQEIHQKNIQNYWKTYRNEEYGVEFKYPEYWYVLGGTKQVPIIISSTGKPASSGGFGEEIIIYQDGSHEIGTYERRDIIDDILSTFKFISTSTNSVEKSNAQEGSYKPGSVVVTLKAGVNQTNFDKFIKNYNLKILSEVKGVYVEIGVPDGKEQIFVNLFESVSGVESAMLNSSPSLTN